MNGAGCATIKVPDATGIGTNVATLRSQHSGVGNCCVYYQLHSFRWNGRTSHETVKVGVPHDKTKTPTDGGPLYPATELERERGHHVPLLK